MNAATRIGTVEGYTTNSASFVHVLGHGLNATIKSQARPIVFVVDHDVSVRDWLEVLIRRKGWEPETATSTQEFLARPRATVPNCLVLDVSVPGVNALDLQRLAARERPDMPVIFLTERGDVPTTVQAMKAGAFEFFTKPFRGDLLLTAIREALEQSRFVLNKEAEMRVIRNAYASLSGRERQVMGLLVSGLLNKQVGGELGITEHTVKVHRGRVMQKMQADSFAHLVRMASKLGVGCVESQNTMN